MVETRLRQKSCQFLRIHKSYLVNAGCISGYSRDYVLLTTGEQLRISKYEYYRSLNEHLQARKRTKAGRRPQYHGGVVPQLSAVRYALSSPHHPFPG